MRALAFKAAYTWLDATFRSRFLTCVSSGCATPDTPVAAGTRIPGVPRSQCLYSLHYGVDHGWQFDVDGQFMDAVPTDDLNTVQAPAYALLGMGAGYIAQLGSWRTHVFARINNALARRYVGSVIVNEGNGRYFEPGPGRTFLLGVDLRWQP